MKRLFLHLSNFFNLRNLPQTYPFYPSTDPSFVLKYCGSPQGIGIPDAIATPVLGNSNLPRVYRKLDDHMVDSAVNDNHIFMWSKVV